MRIKRLDITGFKSFLGKTVFAFGDGITAVVGPNGCGKSNVVDAIRWVMGEQSAKNLRGRGMEDVIFNGSETHAPLSLAEVTLTLAVEPQDVLPPTLAGLPEVAVTRRLFRSGESEYQLNRTTCRLLDITELFLGTGVGTKAYSIIEQGRVGQIVSARPEDRRIIIEEAAGVSRYRARRRSAERKLEYTEQNLLRLTDLVGELERQRDGLERQAKKAEKSRRLKAELKGLELHALAHRALELQVLRQAREARLEELRQAGAATQAQVVALEEEIAALRAGLEGEAASLDEVAARVAGLERQAQLDLQSEAHWREDLQGTQARLQALRAEREELALKQAQADASHQEAVGALEALGVASKEDEVLLSVREEELRRSLVLAGQVSARLERERDALLEATGALAAQQGQLGALEQRRHELQARGLRLAGELEALEAEEAQLEAARREVLQRVEEGRLASVELTARLGEEASQLDTLKEAFQENEVAVVAVREELADKRSRLESWEALARSYEGYGRGVQAVMQHLGEGARQAGVFGLLSEVVQAEPHVERAVEAALGQALEGVVVDGREAAYALLEHLRGLREGRATFLSVEGPTLELLPGQEVPVGLGVLGPALAFVRAREPLAEGLLRRLLSGVVVVDELHTARRLAAERPSLTFVTLEGDVLRPHGEVVGGAAEVGLDSLRQRRVAEELRADVGRLEGRYQELLTRHYELQKHVAHVEAVLKGLDKHQHAEELSLRSHEKDLHQAGSTLSRVRERLAAVREEVAALALAQQGLDAEVGAVTGEVMHRTADRAAREERVALLSGEAETLKGTADGLSAGVTELKVKVASAAERWEAGRVQVERFAALVGELRERQARLTVAQDEGGKRAEELLGRLQAAEQPRAERERTLAEERAALEARREALQARSQLVREREGQLRAERLAQEAALGQVQHLSLEVKGLELELGHLESQAFERHGQALHDVLVEHHLRPPQTAQDLEAMRELRGALDRLGDVNLSAIEELQAVQARGELLGAQVQDLQRSSAQLREAIRRIDDTSRERFKQTFDTVNEKFQQVFPRLFGGGRASLLLTNEGPGQEPGVEILAQPPGKKLQSMQLLSGGEKALTAVALIFGIFLIKPTPFCLLDEVDAPLDEGNVGRYNEMVKEMSRSSQFILITHNKRTMEIGDSLYGVTMEEPGISKLVSVKLAQAAGEARAVA